MRVFRHRSTLLLSAALVLALSGGGVASALLWLQDQHLEGDNAELQSEVASLRTAGSGQGGVLGVSSSDPNGVQGNTTTQTPTTSGGSDGSGGRNMLVKDFGIQFKVPEDLSDLSYAENPPASGFLQLTTVALQKAHPCAAAGILGTLFRYPKDQSLPNTASAAKATKVALAGGYEYYYIPLDQDPCKDAAALSAISHLTDEVQPALQTIVQQ
jgi:hypothetical protein